MSDWPVWAGLAVALAALVVSAIATRDARVARKDAKMAQEEAKRTEQRAAIDQLLNQHDIRRSHWDTWGYSETDLAGMRRAIAEWRELCAQQMKYLNRESRTWVVVRDLAEQANEFSRATDSIAARNTRPDGFIAIESEEEDRIVEGTTDQFQKRTHDLVRQLENLRE